MACRWQPQVDKVKSVIFVFSLYSMPISLVFPGQFTCTKRGDWPGDEAACPCHALHLHVSRGYSLLDVDIGYSILVPVHVDGRWSYMDA